MAWLGNEFTQAKFTNYLVVCILLHLNSFSESNCIFKAVKQENVNSSAQIEHCIFGKVDTWDILIINNKFYLSKSFCVDDSTFLQNLQKKTKIKTNNRSVETKT